ncbi:MAG TPA: hypothetical protein VLA83_18150 [Candidatus Binatia bacterium]|nr:hypothetical protein [Candidatus Binatia bacterium]
MPEKSRSAGITVIAILQFLGSALMLALAALMAFAMIVAPTPPPNDQLPPMFFKVMRILVPLFYVLPAVWGIVTAVGLLQLKNWARISTIVFSVLLLVFGAFGVLTSMVFFLKPPPGNGVDPKMFSIIGGVTAVIALAQIGIGIWWMVFFNRARVKAQFLAQPLAFPPQSADPYAIDPRYSTLVPPPGFPASADVTLPPTPPIAAPQRTARPLSISIIAWFMLVTCLFVPISVFLHPPIALFLTILTGWQAVVFMLASAGLNVYVGFALLKMKPVGRLIGIGYFAFGLLNTAVFYFAPGRSARITRFLDLHQSVFPWMRSAQSNPFQPDMMPFLLIGAIGGVTFYLVLLYFLITAKPAFDMAERERAG